eukprot:29081-Pelagococcus_subviridis.AAC.2
MRVEGGSVQSEEVGVELKGVRSGVERRASRRVGIESEAWAGREKQNAPEKHPASCNASARSTISAASSWLRPCGRNPPRTLMD